MHRLLPGIAALLAILFVSGAFGANPSVGFLLNGESQAKLGPEGKAAQELATGELAATVIGIGPNGTFSDTYGRTVPLSAFNVIWYHQGDSIEQRGPVYDWKTLDALKDFAESGHALYLSGAALALVEKLGLESVAPRRGGPGNDTRMAALVPVEPKHPMFEGLSRSGKSVQISNRGYPAYSDFHGHGPPRGMLLAKSPSGAEDPIVEYKLGKGRVIVIGWRLPHYSHSGNPHRSNLEKLTVNTLCYLGNRKQWQKVVVKKSKKKPAAAPAAVETKADFKGIAVPLERAIRDLIATYAGKYPEGQKYLTGLTKLKKANAKLKDSGIPSGELHDQKKATMAALRGLKREALLANPVMDFEELILIRRSARNLGMPANWQSNSSLRHTGYNNDIVLLSLENPAKPLTVLFKPEGNRFVGDIDLHFNADRMLFSMPGTNGRWQVHEIMTDGKSLRELPLIIEKDVDNYDACYLPDGRIIFSSTAPFIGVPCVKGSSHVTNLYILDPATGKIRRLTFDQDHNWCPTVLNNGRILYLRWEYSDIPHYVARILFHMNPDGTNQAEYYGSNSYWPNSIFYARPVPGHPTMVAGIVTGHHGVKRVGELVLFDPAKGRFEADGVVQRIPGHGKKVEPIILDRLVNKSWPKFLHPFPLSAKYHLVSAQPSPRSNWGVYLVDVFDNMLLLKEESGFAMLEPIPLRKRPIPPAVPDRMDPARKDATIYITDIYNGPGLAGVPRGTVKNLRLVTYHFAYHGMGGQINRVGMDGPWDIKRVLGTVPVERDGSALFTVPANTPISFQALDGEGKAVQLMRSWSTAMPGEYVSCAGCHEPQNIVPPNGYTIASRRNPASIVPWRGETRGFSFRREVQPVLDRYCVGCHNGTTQKKSAKLLNFTARPPEYPKVPKSAYMSGTKFTPAYMALRSFVRTPTIESDMHLNAPYEWHADTTKLFQMLKNGHHNVKLNAEAWDRLVTWFDLGAPAHGTWKEIVGEKLVEDQCRRRREMMTLYAGIDENPEKITRAAPRRFVAPERETAAGKRDFRVTGWPFDTDIARKLQAGAAGNGGRAGRTVDLAGGIKLELVRIPPGEFIMGSTEGSPDEYPTSRVRIGKPFWMAKLEINNRQYALFDPSHDSRIEHGDFLQFSVTERGYPMNTPCQPVVRVSWERAMDFCQWLSQKTGRKFTLPTEGQWEWACRAGSATPMWFGALDTDFSNHANLADMTLRKMPTLGWGLPSGAVWEWKPAAETVEDEFAVSCSSNETLQRLTPNPWGLYNMHGNVSEWTLSLAKDYPYRDDDGRNAVTAKGKRIARGGSWDETPKRTTSSFRLHYHPWQKVYDVGFRVIMTD